MNSRTGTLTPSTVTTVTLNGDARSVEVMNLDGAAAIWFTVDGADPTVNGADEYALPAAISSRPVKSPASGTTVIKLISSGSPRYFVLSLDE